MPEQISIYIIQFINLLLFEVLTRLLVLQQPRLQLAHTAEACDIGMRMRALHGYVKQFASQHIGGAIKATLKRK